MKKLNKIGLTIFASTLFASSAFAGSMSVSGSAQLIYSTSDADGVTGNAFSMDDSIVFSGSGELDNGYTWSYSMELDPGATTPAATTADTECGVKGIINFIILMIFSNSILEFIFNAIASL